MRKQKPTGLLGPDPYDPRDIDYEKHRPLLSTRKIPEEYPEMLDYLTRVTDQYYGSCTSHGSNNCKEHQETRETKNNWLGSSRFIYHNTKKVSGLWDNQGDYSRNAAKAIEKFGVCPADVYPDKPKNNWEEYVREEPPKEAYEKAERFKIKSYAKVWPRIEALQNAILRESSPVSVAMQWFSSYYRTPKNGVLPDPDGASGWHNVCFITWVKDEKLGPKWVVKNSHGEDFGDNGYFYIPFDQWQKHNVRHGWVYTDIDNSIAKTMLKRYIKDDEQFIKKDDRYYHIPDVATLSFLMDDLEIVSKDEPEPIEGSFEIAGRFPSYKLMEYSKEYKDILDDVFSQKEQSVFRAPDSTANHDIGIPDNWNI